MARGTQARSRLLWTIGLIWLASLAVIVVITLTSAGEKTVSNFTEAEQAAEARCRAAAGLPSDRDDNPNLYDALQCYRSSNPDWDVPQYESSYDVRSGAIGFGAVTLLAAVAVGTALIWTRPDEGSEEGPSHAATPRNAVPSLEPEAAELPASTPVSVVESLRRLQALHAEGLLTDDEYESKRKSLAEQL